ncbi:MAG: coproporphyrinogen III oxidase, partial [Deltaproteobacteria bacterium]|nr:coproporphyrinogen III oxidase [Deltaproteobacteria bacterium]
LSGASLRRYEISNYALPGCHSRHNVNYWRSGDYLGLGAGAHSYMRGGAESAFGRRWSNEKNPGRYMALVAESNHAVVDREEIGAAKAAGEFLFLGLRMTEGISTDSFRARFGRSPHELYPQIADWIEGKLIEQQHDFLRLTTKGLMVANSIFVQFV